MSDLVLKSPLLTGLNFKYSQDSVIRFVGKRNVQFFDCFGVPEKVVLDLINYTIEHSDEIFHVSYYTYKAGIPLYISNDKLVSKPFWFNQAEYSDTFRSSANTSYVSMPLTDSMIKLIDTASKTMEIQKGHLMMLATLTEYSPNPWTGDRKESFENIMECALNLKPHSFPKPENDYTHQTKHLDWTKIASNLKKLTGEKACDADQIAAFIIKSKNAFSEHRDVLKDTQEIEKLKYVISAYRADGILVHSDEIPAVFNLRNLDALFSQNMEYYKHVLYLEVYDPFDEESFVYYPSLTNVYADEKPHRMFFSVPASFFYWLATICGSKLRSRNSTVRQALHNFLTDWKEQWKAVPKAQKAELMNIFSQLGSIIQCDPNYVFKTLEDIEAEKAPRSRTKKTDDSEVPEAKAATEPSEGTE